ncbi:MAG TPA: hypothetical protein VLJ79_21885 [Candidatus Binatia bacterium]|nr:hypothetical protein [Candidatus Binatia bacterium]
MTRVKALCRPLLAALVFLSCSRWAQAQLIPLNFVYTGSGSQSDALKFSYESGFFRKRGLDLTMLYVTSGVTTSQTIVSGAWDSIPEFKARSGVDLKKFVDSRFINEALSEIK